jgi:cell division protein FtsI/penicillin-binding protein 2
MKKKSTNPVINSIFIGIAIFICLIILGHVYTYLKTYKHYELEEKARIIRETAKNGLQTDFKAKNYACKTMKFTHFEYNKFSKKTDSGSIDIGIDYHISAEPKQKIELIYTESKFLKNDWKGTGLNTFNEILNTLSKYEYFKNIKIDKEKLMKSITYEKNNLDSCMVILIKEEIKTAPMNN